MRSVTSLANYGHGGTHEGITDNLGFTAVMDFYTFMAKVGAAYQVRAGTLSVPIVGDVLITDTAAEMCVDAASGTTVIPTSCNINFNLAAATLFECAGKSVAGVSTVGTVFIPLKLRSNGAAAVSTARAMTAGGCTVTAETALTTLRHFSWGHPIAAGAWSTVYDWEPRVVPVLAGGSTGHCFYVQIAGDTTGPSYFASFDFIEGPTATLLG